MVKLLFMQPQHHERGPEYAPGGYVDPRAQLAAGVERFIAGVFAWMAAGLGLTAVVSWALSTQEALLVTIFGGPLMWVALLAPIAFVWFVAPRIPKMERGMAVGVFFVYAAMIGIMLSPLPLIYSVGTLGGTFLATSIMFGGMAAFGYLTKRDLSGVGRFLMMAFWGLFAAWIVSWFIPGVYFWVAAAGVVIFAGLTAWDTQKIKQFYLENGDRGNLAILGALILYIDFVNMFLFLLRLFGGSRD